MTATDLASRLAEAEAKLSFAEDQIDALNATVFRQQALIDGLQEQLRLLFRQMQTFTQDEAGDAGDRLREDIPPHY